jgi:hypothetical protein
LNVVAIDWTEGSLQRVMGKFYPIIKVICETPKFVDAFSPLIYVPANFVFNKGGKRLLRNGQRECICKDTPAAILAGTK